MTYESGLPLVSVIIPVYNACKFLDACVCSVCSQSYSSWEMILVDDGSEDGSSELCDHYAASDSRIRAVHQKNAGQSSARNVGIRLSKGKYLYFLDSDDYIEPELLRRTVEKAEMEQAELVCFSGNCLYEGDRRAHSRNSLKRMHSYETDTGIELFSQMVKAKEYHGAVWLMLIDRNFLRAWNIMFDEGMIYEDELFTYKLFCRAERACCLPEQLHWYRIRAGSTVTRKPDARNYTSICAVYAGIRDFSFDRRRQYEQAVSAHIARFASNTLNVYRRLPWQTRKDLRGLYRATAASIKADGYYSDTALKMKCTSELLWAIYKTGSLLWSMVRKNG